MSASPVEVFVALGSNLGDRSATLRQAVSDLNEAAGITVLAASRVYESAAHTRPPHAPQPPYLNAAARIATTRSPHALLDALLDIERNHGRVRTDEWSARTLDLDLLLYGNRVLAAPGLTLPHPRLHLRRFVLQPLADLAPGLVLPHPYHATVAALLAACPDATPLRATPHTLF